MIYVDNVMLTEALHRYGGFRQGHFAVGELHSDAFFDKHSLLLSPTNATRLYEKLARRIEDSKPDAIMGIAVSGLVIAYEVARYLQCDYLYCDPHSSLGIGEYWGDYDLTKYHNIVVADDIVVSGNTMAGVVRECVQAGFQVSSCIALLCYPGCWDHVREVPLFGLGETPVHEYPVGDCPLCNAGVPLELIR